MKPIQRDVSAWAHPFVFILALSAKFANFAFKYLGSFFRLNLNFDLHM